MGATVGREIAAGAGFRCERAVFAPGDGDGVSEIRGNRGLLVRWVDVGPGSRG